MHYALFLLLFSITLSITDAVDCSVSNGGCAQYCFDRGDGNGFCGCDCFYQLAGDSLNCEPITPCDVDVLFLVDASAAVTQSCVLGSLTAEIPGVDLDKTQWADWQTAMSSLLDQFSATSYAVGQIIAGISTLERDYATATNSWLTSLKADITTYSDACGSDDPITTLSKTFSNPDFGSILVGPTNGRDGTTTARIAVVGMVVPIPQVNIGSHTMEEYVDSIYTYYDQIFVVGSDNTLGLESKYSPADLANYLPHMNYLGCQNTTTDCALVTFTDNVNAFSANPNDLIPSKIDTGACIKRKTKPTSNASCSDTTLTVTIPSCLLGGLIASDLQLNDPSCTGTTHATTSGDYIIFAVDFSESCGWTSSMTTVSGVQFMELSQQVLTVGTFGAGTNPAPISISASCSFPMYTNEQLGIFNPAVNILTATISAPGEYSVVLSVYPNSSYVSPYSPGSISLIVNSRVYIEALASMPANTFLVLKSALATSDTSSTSSPFWIFMENNCINDTDFQLEPESNTAAVRFSFLMFEWSATANSAVKLPVYVHMTFTICTTGDTTVRCTQSCSTARRRRDVNDDDDDDSLSISQVIGPLTIARQEDEEWEDDEEMEELEDRFSLAAGIHEGDNVKKQPDYVPHEETVEHKETAEVPGPRDATYNIFLPAPSFGIIVYWFLLILTTICLFHFIAKCLFRPNNAHMVASPTWSGLASAKGGGDVTKVPH